MGRDAVGRDAVGRDAASALTITDAVTALRAGTTTSAALVEQAIAVADATDAELGCFLVRFRDQARAAATGADETLARGDDVGPLHGIPLGVKDIITTAEAPTTAQSLVLDPAWSHGDAVVVRRLREAGGIIMGKTTTMEFAIGIPDASKPFPIPKNPWDTSRWAGGSSSGSGSAVATGAVLGALGTDTAGSIRTPSAFCGTTGLLPTFGRVPKSGCVPLAHSLDHIGPMARSARDCALMLQVLAGYDASDAAAMNAPPPDFPAALTGDLTGLRIGVDRLDRAGGDGVDQALPTVLDDAVAVFAGLGAAVMEIELPYYEELVAAGIVIMLSEALAYHLPDLRTRWLDYFAGTRAMVATGAFYSGADYVQAQRVRRAGRRALAALFDDVDLIITPTAGAGALRFTELAAVLEVAGPEGFGPIYTQYWNSVGGPVVAIPMGFTGDGLPLGLQLAGRPCDEAGVLRAADAYQRVTGWHLQRPPLPPLSPGPASMAR